MRVYLDGAVLSPGLIGIEGRVVHILFITSLHWQSRASLVYVEWSGGVNHDIHTTVHTVKPINPFSEDLFPILGPGEVDLNLTVDLGDIADNEFDFEDQVMDFIS